MCHAHRQSSPGFAFGAVMFGLSLVGSFGCGDENGESSSPAFAQAEAAFRRVCRRAEECGFIGEVDAAGYTSAEQCIRVGAPREEDGDTGACWRASAKVYNCVADLSCSDSQTFVVGDGDTACDGFEQEEIRVCFGPQEGEADAGAGVDSGTGSGTGSDSGTATDSGAAADSGGSR